MKNGIMIIEWDDKGLFFKSQSSLREKERRQRASHPKQHHRTQEFLLTGLEEKEAFVPKKDKAARRRGFDRY
jgi:hypothetical protein